jgi:hypothetical protein
MFIMEIKSPIILEPVQWPVLDSLNKHISIIKQLQLSKILLQIVATQTHVYILILCHYRLNLRSTDTARRIRRYEYGDTGYGDFKKQWFGDTSSICIGAYRTYRSIGRVLYAETATFDVSVLRRIECLLWQCNLQSCWNSYKNTRYPQHLKYYMTIPRQEQSGLTRRIKMHIKKQH